ncbi:helix-turn-helix transcriptional regulator [Sphingobacterium kyonggiense]
MSVDIKKRFDRIVDILIQLQSKKIVKAQDLADRFEVSLRTIYRDIKSLEQAGVPLIGEAGNGYSIMDGYRLPPVSFTRDEALTFVALEKLAEKYLDKESNKQIHSAMLKIKAILKSNDQEMVHSMQDQIIMRKQNSPLFLDQAPEVLSHALNAIAHQKQMEITYQGIHDDIAQNRIVEPIGIVHEIGYWYIVAYCLKRNDFRQFRSDRIIQAELLDLPFLNSHPTIDEYIKLHPPIDYPKTKVTIAVTRDFAPYIRWQRNHYGFIKEEINNDRIIMHFESRDTHQEFPRWLMMFADHIEVIEPENMRQTMQKLLFAMGKNMSVNY